MSGCLLNLLITKNNTKKSFKSLTNAKMVSNRSWHFVPCTWEEVGGWQTHSKSKSVTNSLAFIHDWQQPDGFLHARRGVKVGDEEKVPAHHPPIPNDAHTAPPQPTAWPDECPTWRPLHSCWHWRDSPCHISACWMETAEWGLKCVSVSMHSMTISERLCWCKSGTHGGSKMGQG